MTIVLACFIRLCSRPNVHHWWEHICTLTCQQWMFSWSQLHLKEILIFDNSGLGQVHLLSLTWCIYSLHLVHYIRYNSGLGLVHPLRQVLGTHLICDDKSGLGLVHPLSALVWCTHKFDFIQVHVRLHPKSLVASIIGWINNLTVAHLHEIGCQNASPYVSLSIKCYISSRFSRSEVSHYIILDPFVISKIFRN